MTERAKDRDHQRRNMFIRVQLGHNSPREPV
jgi:hypothetical protein